MSPFPIHEVQLLRSYPEEGLRVGDIVILIELPDGRLYLANDEGDVFEDKARPNVDFVLTPEEE